MLQYKTYTRFCASSVFSGTPFFSQWSVNDAAAFIRRIIISKRYIEGWPGETYVIGGRIAKEFVVADVLVLFRDKCHVLR